MLMLKKYAELKINVRISNSEMRYSCNDCDYHGKEEINLENRRQFNHERKNKYGCSSTYYSKDRKHHISKYESYKYSCEQCGHTFTQEKNTKRHLEVVHENGKVPCYKVNIKPQT